jgi:outer membrane protein
MMNKILAGLGVMVMSTGVLAQDTKIGIVNLEQALFNSDAAKVVQEELRTEFASDEQRAQTLQGELQALQQKFTQDEAIMSQAEIRAMNADAQEKQLQLQLISERVQQALQEKNQEFVESMRQTLTQAITDVVAEGGFDLILNSSGVAYAAPVLDITARVTAKINELQQRAGQ